MVVMGSALRQRENQYVAYRDENGTWRILNTWDDSLQHIGPEDEIPDDSQAVTVLSEGAFLALVQEATVKGVLQNLSGGGISN